MEVIIYALIVLILLASAFKLSQWGWAPRVVFSAMVAAFVLWSRQFAVLQSKTQIADYLQNTTALQNMAVIVTLDSVFFIAYAFCHFQNPQPQLRRPWWQWLLHWYPGLLVFPVTFYLFTQMLFTFVGVDFGTSAIIFALAALIALPLLAEGARWLLPEKDGRMEMLLLLTCFICVLGLISTESGKMVYKVKESPVDWQMILLSVGVFIVLFGLGIVLDRIKYRLKKKI